MSARPVPILFVHYGGQWIRGSEQILVDHIAHLDTERFSPIVWSNTAPLVQLARSRGWSAHEDRFSVLFDYTTPSRDVRNFLRLRRRAGELLRSHEIGLVHCNASESCQWMVPAARRAGIPIVVHLHNDAAMRSRIVQLVHQATAVVGGGDSMIAPYREEGVSPEFLRVIYNNVDTERISAHPPVPRASFGIRDGEFVFASVGSLIRRKGMDLLIRAFAEVRATHGHVRLAIIGGGPERQALQALADSLGLGDRVVFVGETSNASGLVRDLSDTSVLTSHWEGFPLVLLEAGFFSRPVVATNVGGVPDLIWHEDTGLLVPPNDVTAVRDAMLRVLAEPELRQSMGANLGRRVHTEMLAPANTRQLEALYDECLLAQAQHRTPGWRWYPGYSRWIRQSSTALWRRLSSSSPRRPA